MRNGNCKICGELMNNNHLRKHDISVKDYCVKYLNYPCTCYDCGAETTFFNSTLGFAERCMICANREIGRKKEELYKTFKIKRKCKNCKNTFIMDSRHPKSYCTNPKCNRYSPSDRKNIDDIINYNFHICPYCNFKVDGWSSMVAHLHKHFPPDELERVKEKIETEILNLELPKCKNKECNGMAERQDKGRTYKNFCKSCNCTGGKAKDLLYSEEELKEMARKQSVSISKTYKKKISTPEGLAEIRKINAETGRKNSKFLRKYFRTKRGKEQLRQSAKKQSASMKKLIANGKFTPNITNSWTHWDAIIKINNKKFKFRSSWEACFYLCNQHTKYEILRIPYVDKTQMQRTYIADFYDVDKKILYEIKPASVYLIQQPKMDATIEYCLKNKIKFVWVNEKNMAKYVDKSKFIGYNLKQYEQMMKGIGHGKIKN